MQTTPSLNDILMSFNGQGPDTALTALAQPQPNLGGATGGWADPSVDAASMNAPAAPTAAAVQAIVDNALKDPAFRKMLGVDSDSSLIANAAGWNLPKTGKVNTTGAMERINANSKTGAVATRDANGQLTITNVGQQAEDKQKLFNLPNPALTEVSVGITGAMQSLRNAPDMATALPFADSIRNSVATEQAMINQRALEFASRKLNIPALEANVQRLEMLQQQSPSWFPGIGDAPATKAAKAELLTMRNQAAGEAQNWLAQNPTSRILDNQLKSANAALELVNKKQSVVDNLADRSAQKAADAQDKAALLLDAFSPAQKAAMLTLNPSLKEDNPQGMMLAMQKLTQKGSPAQAAIEAVDDTSGVSLVKLAASDNASAKILLKQKERELRSKTDPTGLSYNEAEIDLMLADVKKKAMSLKPKEIADFMLRSNPNATPEERRAILAEQNVASIKSNTDAKAKADMFDQNMRIAIQMQRQSATNRFVDDTSKWGVTDLEFTAAMSATLAGKQPLSFENVVATYVGSSTGSEATAKLMKLNGIARQAIAKQSDSFFGKPSSVYLEGMLAKKAASYSIWNAMGEFLNRSVDAPLIGSPVGVAVASAKGINKFIDHVVNPYVDSFKVKSPTDQVQ